MQPRFNIIVLAAFVIAHAPVRAETVADYEAALQQSLQSQANSTNEAPQLQPIPSISPATPAPQNSDRKNSNGAAQALAIAGAAMAMMSCMQLMKAAQEAREAGDTDKANMYQAMAMQQCAQGMKDMGAAQDNGSNKDQLSMTDTPKMAQLSTQPMQSPKANTNEPVINVPPSSSSTPELPVSPEFVQSTPTPVNTAGATSTTEVVGPEYSRSILDPIDDTTLKIDENAKNPSGTGNSNQTAFFPSQSMPNSPVAGSSSDKKVGATEEEKRKRAIASSEGDEAEGGSGGNDKAGSGKDGESPSFEAMMGSLFGGPPALPGAAPAAPGDLAGFGAKPGENGEKKSNIFEYASYRYQVLTYAESKVKPKIMPKQTRELASSAFSTEMAAVIESSLNDAEAEAEPAEAPATPTHPAPKK